MNKEPEKVSTKVCPKCGDTQLGEIRSQFIKICANHECPVTEIPWELDEGQKPLQ